MELLESFGIDIKLLLANIINFTLLMLILRKLAYRPILDFVHARQKKIEEGLKNAEEARAVLDDAEASKEALLTDARKEAQNIVAQSKARSEAQAQTIMETAQQEATKLLERSKEQAQSERDSMMKEAQGQISSLVLMLAGQLLRKKMDSESDRAFVENALENLKIRS